MAIKRFNAIIRLRRDTEANYALIANTFIPASGEVCFVSTSNGLKAKVGDGISTFGQLGWWSTGSEGESNVVWGYYLNGKFYTDSTYTEELEKTESKIYLDRNTDKLFIYNGSQFVSIDDMLPGATAQRAGVLKLYNEHGYSEDGAVTQKLFTESIDDILFGIDENDAECLVLDKPW